MERAYGHVQHIDVRNRGSELSEYRALKGNPSISPKKLREAVGPGPAIFAGINSHMIETYGPVDSMFGKIRAALGEVSHPAGESIPSVEWADARHYYHREDGSRILSPRGTDENYRAWELRPTVLGYKKLARVLAAELVDWGGEYGPGGIYLDDWVQHAPPWRIARLREEGVSAIDIAFSREMFVACRRAFLRELRSILPPEFLIIANTWGPSRFSAWNESKMVRRSLLAPVELKMLNGITIEHPTIIDLPTFVKQIEYANALGHGCWNIAWYEKWSLAGSLMAGTHE